MRDWLIEELIWWSKCACVVGLTILSGLLLGWGLAKFTDRRPAPIAEHCPVGNSGSIYAVTYVDAAGNESACTYYDAQTGKKLGMTQ